MLLTLHLASTKVLGVPKQNFKAIPTLFLSRCSALLSHPAGLSSTRKHFYSTTNDGKVTIDGVTRYIKKPERPEFVPFKYLPEELSQEYLRLLRWMLQKDNLGQDMFLLGRPGPLRGRIAYSYAELTGREVEYVALSRDITDSDLKQRREIHNGTAYYVDQCAVRAALNGRILVLDGLEKAERNVLPVLNNLLENREMNLDDGRHLLPPSRYDKLLEESGPEELKRWNLERVSENFRVIALGLPVPKYPGNPLDPPLRSRFQSRNVVGENFQETVGKISSIAPKLSIDQVGTLVSFGHALSVEDASTVGLPDFPLENLHSLGRLMEHCPFLPAFQALERAYPFKSFLKAEEQTSVQTVCKNLKIPVEVDDAPRFTSVKPHGDQHALVEVTLSKETVAFTVPKGTQSLKGLESYVSTPYSDEFLAQLAESHSVHDLAVIGPRGCGKSLLLEHLASLLGYETEHILLYQDMTCRDLLQRRHTLPNGDTVWRSAPLVEAALSGKLAILDGLHRAHPGTLAVLQRLVHDRELQLYDGSRLLRHDRYDEMAASLSLTQNEMTSRGLYKIHPQFRLVGLAEPPNSNSKWLTPEIMSLFLFHEMRPLSPSEEMAVLEAKCGALPATVPKLVELVHKMRQSSDANWRNLAGSLSTRQLIRLAKRLKNFPHEDAFKEVQKSCLARFLPIIAQQSLTRALKDIGLTPTRQSTSEPLRCSVENGILTIGHTQAQICQGSTSSKVPEVLFFDIQEHVKALEALLQDFQMGEHLLLIGNQGVGKNRLIDRLLNLLNRPREYIQLHRDTTVQSLTVQPTVQSGVIVYEDSPLVRAARLGHVLVVDEADKAPTHVTCILKTLVESGEMILSDGRRIVSQVASADDPNVIPLHPNFRMVVLANRPGFPFLGNDFFGVLGDLFSVHAIDNPSFESELSLLKQYGPDVPEKTLSTLVRAFGELRDLADQGQIAYPYSTREVINIVKHLQLYPKEGLGTVIRNVFDFDAHSPEMQKTLGRVLHKHGLPIGASPDNVSLAKEVKLLPPIKTGQWQVRSSAKVPPLPFEENSLTLKGYSLPVRTLKLEASNARMVNFSEEKKSWDLPLDDASVLAGVLLHKRSEAGECISVMHSNPTGLLSWDVSSNLGNLLPLERHFPNPRMWNVKPKFSLAKLTGEWANWVAVYEALENRLMIVEPWTGEAFKIGLESVLNSAVQKFAQTFGKEEPVVYGFAANAANQLVIYQQGGGRLQIVDLDQSKLFELNLPLAVATLHSVGKDTFYVSDRDTRKFLLRKSHPGMDGCANVLHALEDPSHVFAIKGCNQGDLSKEQLSAALKQNMDCPSRVIALPNAVCGVALGFPDLSSGEVYAWPQASGNQRQTHFLTQQSLVINVLEANGVEGDVQVPNSAGYLQIVDLARQKLRYLAVPDASRYVPYSSWVSAMIGAPFLASGNEDTGSFVTVDLGGKVRLWELSPSVLNQSFEKWRALVGEEGGRLMLEYRSSGLDVSQPKFGKVDAKNEPHVGGNQWAGGTGGRDTAGLGGKGGPFRLDAGHTVYQVSDAEKAAVPEHVKRAAHEMAKEAFRRKLDEIRMSEFDAELYQQYYRGVQDQVQALRLVLDSLQAKAKERQWIRHQTVGELDDAKLIEGLTGEKAIYKRRADKEPELGAPQTKPKHFRLVVDVSGSMYRFNGYDGRLEREMEAVLLFMEALQGHDTRFRYDIMGHSGESSQLPLVRFDSPPRNEKERLDVLKVMHAHSQYCLAGDYTLEATSRAIKELDKMTEIDEGFVIVLSDANLERYGIPAKALATALTQSTKIKTAVIFIGSLGDQAVRLSQELPTGNAFVCMELQKLPQILQQIFTAAMLSGP